MAYGDEFNPCDDPMPTRQQFAKQHIAEINALAVPCAYCHAPENQPCINLAVEAHPPLLHFAAHQKRIRDAAQTIPDDDEVPF